MKKIALSIALLLAFLIAGFSACGMKETNKTPTPSAIPTSNIESPTAMPSATEMPTPTAVPTPTAATEITETPVPTETEEPTSTPEATATPGPTATPDPANPSGVVTSGNVIGAKDFSSAFLSEFSPVWAVPVGETVSVKIQTYTDGKETWHCPSVILQNTATGHSADVNAEYREYGILRLDNWGWNSVASVSNADILGWTIENNWNNDTFVQDINNATVTISVTNNITTADVEYLVVTAKGTEYRQTYKNITIDGDLYFCFTVEAAFAEIISHQDKETTGTVVGTLDCSISYGIAYSDIWVVPANGYKKVTFVNYTSREKTSHNFIAILQNTSAGYSVEDAAYYREYAVLRADNYGWKGDTTTENLSALGWILENDWNWETFKTDMDGALVELTVTNKGQTADVVATVTTTYGKTYTQSYKNIVIDGPLYFTLTVDYAALDVQ